MDISPYDAWAEIYDSVFSYVNDDIPFYVDEAVRSGGPVIELGCGTGRVAIPIALNGIDVVGLDSSPLMIERARQKANQTGTSNLELVQADMIDFKFDDKFPACYCALSRPTIPAVSGGHGACTPEYQASPHARW